jgi:hypothetical protein
MEYASTQQDREMTTYLMSVHKKELAEFIPDIWETYIEFGFEHAKGVFGVTIVEYLMALKS